MDVDFSLLNLARIWI